MTWHGFARRKAFCPWRYVVSHFGGKWCVLDTDTGRTVSNWFKSPGVPANKCLKLNKEK